MHGLRGREVLGEDFGGFSYERVWLYVNGQLKASGVPGTDTVAKCGDEVAAGRLPANRQLAL